MLITIITATLVALGLKLFLGWSFWFTLILIGIFSGLGYLTRIYQNAWVRTGVGIVVTIIIVTLAQNFLNGKFPLSASLSNHWWLDKDVRIASTTPPAVQARVAALSLQTAREDASATAVATLYKEGKVTEAMELLQALKAEGEGVRAIITNGASKAPTKVAEVVQVIIQQPPPPAQTPVSPAPQVAPAQSTEKWNVRWVRNGQLLEEDFQLNRNGNTVTMSAADGTELDLSSGVMQVSGKYAGTCKINFSGWNATGWWHDTEKVNLTLRRLS